MVLCTMYYHPKIIRPANRKLVVAVSGGIDSLVAASFLHKNKSLDISAFHFNHKIRPQNDQMEEKVVEFCSDFNIQLIVKRCNTPFEGGSSEAFYREQRYAAMEGLGYVVTGQHLDDQVESYVNNCFCGNPEYLPMPLITEYPSKGFTVLRPFCLTTKQQMVEYVESNDLQKYVVEDETNTDENIKRNWIRHTLVPQIRDRDYNLEKVVKKKILERISKL